MRSVGVKEKRGAKKELQRCNFLDRKISKRFLRPRNNKLSQVTVYLFLGPKKAAVLISKIYFKKPPKLPHALKLSSFSALVINGPWFKSCSVLKLKLEAGCLRDIFLSAKLAVGKPGKGNCFSESHQTFKVVHWLGWLPKIGCKGDFELMQAKDQGSRITLERDQDY